MKKFNGVFFVGACEVNLPVSAETEQKARQLLTLACINAGGNPKTVKLN